MPENAPPNAKGLSRRRLLARGSKLGVLGWLAQTGLDRAMADAPATAAASSIDTPRPRVAGPLCLFSKCFQPRGVAQLAEAVASLGFRYVDLTCRTGGHVLPERVADDLPKAAEILAAQGLRIAMLTTEITSVDQPHALDVLRTAAKLGIRHLKLGYYRCSDPRQLQPIMQQARAELARLVPVLQELNLWAGLHNHSGLYLGAMLWDKWELLRDLPAESVGSFFDACHATIEGGLGGWQMGLQLLAPRMRMLAVKDFAWQQRDGKWKAEMVPMGSGMVRWPTVLKRLKEARFAGPITLHTEYTPHVPPSSAEEQSVFAAVRADSVALRQILAEAKWKVDG